MASNGNIDEHVAKFGNTIWTIMNLFWETLPTPIQKQVMTCENPPTSLDQWYEKLTKFHSNWQKMQCIYRRKNQGTKQNNGKKKISFPIKKEKDPNAMDVDAMTMDERSQLMKKEACFNCKQIGHLSKDFPNKKQGPSPASFPGPPTLLKSKSECGDISNLILIITY